MQDNLIRRLFDIPAHNPSFMSVKAATGSSGELLDFCVPVNIHFPATAMMQRLVDQLPEVLRFYPDYADVHQWHIAALEGIDAECVVPANGSTEVITALCQEAAGPLVTCVPTFGRWTDLPSECGVPLHVVERRREHGFGIDVAEMIEQARIANAATVVLSNPNNPTAAAMPLDDIAALASALYDVPTVIIDESFIDFSNLQSATTLVEQLPNVVVVKSMGKSLGWHGIRLGYAAANRQRAEAMRKRLPFWNVNGVAAFILRNLADFATEYATSFEKVARDRDYMTARLRTIRELTVYPSLANFVFVELPHGVSGRTLRDRLLAQHGMLVRETSNKRGSSEQYLRLAVLHPGATDALEKALRAELSDLVHASL